MMCGVGAEFGQKLRRQYQRSRRPVAPLMKRREAHSSGAEIQALRTAAPARRMPAAAWPHDAASVPIMLHRGAIPRLRAANAPRRPPPAPQSHPTSALLFSVRCRRVGPQEAGGPFGSARPRSCIKVAAGKPPPAPCLLQGGCEQHRPGNDRHARLKGRCG